MIVGPGDSKSLEKCLSTFKAKETFDEIVLVLTTKDNQVREVAEKYTDKIYYQEWACSEYPFGNFSRARNIALDNTTSDYVMWLDSDDICLKEFQDKLKTLKDTVLDPKNNEIDVYFMQYTVVSDDFMAPLVSFMRERIFKRSSGFHWYYPVHEQFLTNHSERKFGILKNVNITHGSNKPSFVSAERNVRILEHEVNKNVDTVDKSHLKYFLGRDLLIIGRTDEAIKYFKDMVDSMDSNPENIFSACLDLIFYYSYGGIEPRPLPQNLNIKNETEIETWCRTALAFSQDYAEPLIILGDLCLHRGDGETAKKLFSSALTKKYGRSGMQTATYYEELPCYRLSKLLSMEGDNERALFHNRRAISKNPQMKEYYFDRKEILTNLINEFTKIPCPV